MFFDLPIKLPNNNGQMATDCVYILCTGDWLYLHHAKEYIEEFDMHSRSTDTGCRFPVWADSTG